MTNLTWLNYLIRFNLNFLLSPFGAYWAAPMGQTYRTYRIEMLNE